MLFRSPKISVTFTITLVTPSIVSAPTLCTVTVFPDLIDHLIMDIFKEITGTKNLVNSGPIYHTQILNLIPNCDYSLVTDEELSEIILEGRSNNVLKSSYETPLAIDSIKELISNYY